MSFHSKTIQTIASSPTGGYFFELNETIQIIKVLFHHPINIVFSFGNKALVLSTERNQYDK